MNDIQLSNLNNQTRSQLMRRFTSDGVLAVGGRYQALRTKMERFLQDVSIDSAPSHPDHHWFSIGPRNINGRIKCLAMHPSDSNILYAGAASGGVWKTINGGQSWMPTMHAEKSLAIGALAINPSNPNIIYAGTGEPLYFIPHNKRNASEQGWYYEGIGIYISTNGGESWHLVEGVGNEFIYRIAVNPSLESHLLCAGYSLIDGAGGLFESRDSGWSWTKVISEEFKSDVFTDVIFDPKNTDCIYAGNHNGGILKSTDGGVTWQLRNDGLPNFGTIGRVNLSIARANPNILYAKIAHDGTGGLYGLYRTSHGAEDGWHRIKTHLDRTPIPTIHPDEKSWWCSHITVDPTDPNGDIIFSGGKELARSVDGGKKWLFPEPGRPTTHVDYHDMVFDPVNSQIVYIATDGGVFRGEYSNTTTPATWTKVSHGLTVTQFYDVDFSQASPSLFGGGCQDNGSLLSTGGLSWRHVKRGDGGYVAFHPHDPYTVYVQSQDANIQRSTDGAKSFVAANRAIGDKKSGIFPATVMVIDSKQPNILFAGTNNVYRTMDSGNSWKSADNAKMGPVTEIVISPHSLATVYAGALDGKLYRSIDGGESFQQIAPEPTMMDWPNRWLSGIVVDPSNANKIYVSFLGCNDSEGCESNHIWTGELNPDTSSWTWTMTAAGLPDVPVGGLVIDPVTSIIYIATDVGVFRSTNDGLSWEPFETGLPNVAVVDLALDDERRVLRAATHGRGMYQLNLDGPYSEVDLYLRDNLLDTSGAPSPLGLPDPTQPGAIIRHDQSADIKVVAPPFDREAGSIDGVEFDHPHEGVPHDKLIEIINGITHSPPIPGEVNRVYVQIHNRGWSKANTVDVKVLYAESNTRPPSLPDDFWSSFHDDGFDQTDWKWIASESVTDLIPSTPQVLCLPWDVPSTLAKSVYLLAMVHSPQDPLLPQSERNVDDLTWHNKRVTLLHVTRPDANSE